MRRDDGAGRCYTIPMRLCYGKRIQGTDGRVGTMVPGRLSPLGAGGINRMGVCGGWSEAESRHCLPYLIPLNLGLPQRLRRKEVPH